MKTRLLSFQNAPRCVVGLLILFTVIAGTGCVTESRVKKWNDKHPVQASHYCSIHFPVEEQTQVEYRIDSADYNNVVDSIRRYTDSILDAAKASGKDTQYIEQIREKIKTEIRWRLLPCLDSTKVVIKTVENTARVKYLQGLLDAKDMTITKRDARITEIESKLSTYKKIVWVFGILLLIALLYITRRLWLPILSIIKPI